MPRAIRFIPALLLLVAVSCGPELVVGRNPGMERDTIVGKDSFTVGEPVAILLKNAVFKDNLLELAIFSVTKEGKTVPVQTVRLPAIDPALDWLHIPEGLFSLPFPGRYRITISQLGEVIAEKTVTVREGP